MKKTILKTALITLGSVIFALAAVFGVMALFFPGALADVFDKAGDYSFSVAMYERQYNADKSLESLKNLVIKLDEEKNAEKTDKYSTIFVDDSGYSDYVAENGVDLFGSVELSNEYFFGKCVISKVNGGGFDKALTYTEKYLETFGYTEFNPARLTISQKINSLSAENKTALKDYLEDYRSSHTLSADETARINGDISLLG